jgi:ACS family hexuronate transporter-like MFS transporter
MTTGKSRVGVPRNGFVLSFAGARWIAITVFVLSSVLNYLDRQVLATMVDIWRLHPADFTFSYEDYGLLLSVFSLAYAISAPFMGWFLDKTGLNRGISISVLIWAVTSIATGFVHHFWALLVCRTILGVAEAGGIAAVGKAVGLYLNPPERSVGTAMNQLGLSLGAGLAPHFAVFFAYRYDWRWCFFAVGAVSLFWVPLWLLTSRAIPPTRAAIAVKERVSMDLLRDPRLWAMTFANFTGMTIYSLWTNWTPTYLIKVHHLTPIEARNYSWIVPICGYFGAMLGGGTSWLLVKRGLEPVEARKKVCLVASVLLLFTATIPLLPTPALATLGMSLSFFCAASWSANMYTIPVDVYGAEHAALGVGALLFAYGAMQTVLSRPLGYIIDVYGFVPVCLSLSIFPVIASSALLLFVKVTREDSKGSLSPNVNMAPATE